jgi:hypothetical protein
MPRTVDTWVDDADDLIRRVEAWKRNELEQILNPPAGASPNRIELKNVSEKAARFAAQARNLLSKPAAELARNADHKFDLLDIVEDCSIGAEEGDGVVDPDAVWREIDRETKEHLANKVRMPREKVDLLRARLRGDRRGEPSSAVKPAAAPKAK